MKVRLLAGNAMVALALAIAVTGVAQDSQPLSKKEAKKLLKQSKKDLKKADQASQRGEVQEAADRASRYAENMQRLNENFPTGNVDDFEALELAERVDKATLKHEATLLDVLERVPDHAKPAIERALEASRRGHDTATEAVLRRGQVDLEGILTDRATRGAMKKNEALLRQAERAQQRGDNAAVSRNVEQYAANMDRIGRAIEQGQVDEFEAVSVFDRVDRNTRRHSSKLEGLLGEVPESARPAIERALQESARGNQMATQALQRSRAAGIQAGRPAGVGGGPGNAGGLSSGARGRPSGAGGGPPSNRPGPPN